MSRSSRRLPGSVEDVRGLRAARWIRESTQDQYARYGPDAQRELQDRALVTLGLVDSGLAWEPAHSGSTVYRGPAMAAMLDAARAGSFDVLVVAYVDRWQRNLRQTLNVLEDELHPAGVVVWFCDEEILSSNDRHWDQLVDLAKAAESWLRKHRRRVAAGLRAKRERLRDPGGHPPYGFRRVDRLVEPDPERLPNVRRVYELSAAGLPDREVAATVDLPLFTVRGILTSPLYVGRLRDGGPARWTAVVDRSTWEHVQAIRAHRATNGGRPADPRRPYALPMLHCRACGRRLTGDTGYYRHREPCDAFLTAKPRSRRGLGSGYRQAWYEGVVEQLLERIPVDDATLAEVVGLTAEPEVDRLALARIDRERDEALTRYRRDRDTEALTTTMARLDEDETLARVPRDSGLEPAEVVRLLRELPEVWRAAPASRAFIAASLFERIEVLGFRRAWVHLTDTAVGRGYGALMPESLSLPVYGRGERTRADTYRDPAWVATLRCRITIVASGASVGSLSLVRSA